MSTVTAEAVAKKQVPAGVVKFGSTIVTQARISFDRRTVGLALQGRGSRFPSIEVPLWASLSFTPTP